MMLRAVIRDIRVNQLVLGDPLCDCGECPTVDVSQSNVHEHVSDLKVGDKMESQTGNLWYRVDDWSTDFDFANPDDRETYLRQLSNVNPEFNLESILDVVFGSVEPEYSIPHSIN